MKILYGVQGTGNGHLSRARAIAPHLSAAGLDTDFVFSGRRREHYFDMEPFGAWRSYAGLTFVTANGKVNPLATARRNNLWRLWRDITTLDVRKYDLVITDFEPVSAWAARRAGIPSLGIGHQYAFQFPVPTCGDSALSRLVMRHFAPADTRLGLHWHHFDQPILPPICDLDDYPEEAVADKILVYLGFENPAVVIPLLQQFPRYQFYYYGEFPQASQDRNIHLRPLSRNGFKRDLANCNGVICNAGFELTSEALHLGKRVLVKPLAGQMEQLSNALALTQLQLGSSMNTLDAAAVATWLDTGKAPSCRYPDVARAIVEWIVAGDFSNPDALIRQLWSQTTLQGLTTGPRATPVAAADGPLQARV